MAHLAVASSLWFGIVMLAMQVARRRAGPLQMTGLDGSEAEPGNGLAGRKEEGGPAAGSVAGYATLRLDFSLPDG